jgi:subtilase family serine protease
MQNNIKRANWKQCVLANLRLLPLLALGGTAAAAEKAVVDGAVSTEQSVVFNIYLPLQDRAGVQALLDELHSPTSALFRHWLTPAEFDAKFASKAETVNAISTELASHGLQVTEVHSHGLQVVGTVAAVQEAFGASLNAAHFSSGRSVMVAPTPLHLTPTLSAANAVIANFSGRIRMSVTSEHISGKPLNRDSPTGGYWFDDLKQAYSYPSYTSLTGEGVTIGVLMTPGYNPSDMRLYFSHEKLATPNIHTFDVEGGAPYNAASAAETHIDIQHSGGMAPKASIILYNLPDLEDDSILAGLTQIIEYNVADVVNMSFGGPEGFYSPAYNDGVDYSGILGIYDDFFMEGNALGITWVAASGDSGALDIPAVACFSATPPDPCGAMQLGVGIPAASPHVTAVGGTNLVTTYNASKPTDLNSAYVSENADDDPLVEDIWYGTTATGAVWGSGGGISSYFAKPSYQTLVSQTYVPAKAKNWRTIPDVALEMGGCPFGSLYYELNGVCAPDRSFDWTALGGEFLGYVGTSLSSPDFVGLTALKIQLEGSRLGNENYEIYSLAAAQENGSGNRPFRRDITGNNGYYKAEPGYNLVLGNGTVVGRDFVLGPALPAAGIPQTPSNP